MEDAQKRRMRTGQRTILFVDEIHRFNKAQQDALPHVESGEITLIGATTENPRSPSTLFLPDARPWSCPRWKTNPSRHCLPVPCETSRKRERTAGMPRIRPGMGRSLRFRGWKALLLLDELLQWASDTGVTSLSLEAVQEEWSDGGPMNYDRSEAHYDYASALIKSMRGSDPDASLFYMCRMLEGGEDPLFLLRRLVIFASEDIGMADPRALQVVTAALQAFQFVGLPEGAIPLAQAVVHCATSPKSNGSYSALRKAQRAVRSHPLAAPPKHLLNAPTARMKKRATAKGIAILTTSPVEWLAGCIISRTNWLGNVFMSQRMGI